jgi:predicted DsbA family dithiol-disulfide isomerase
MARVIEVFADVACPFTHVGLRRFVHLRAEAGRDRGSDAVRLFVRSWPLEIVNAKPLAPDFVAEEIDELRAQVAPDMFAGFAKAKFPSTTVPAMALAAAAYEADLETGEAVSLELRDLLFEQGVDISDEAALADLGARYSLDTEAADPDRVRADHAEGMARGVIGSPHFFTRVGDFFCPSLDVSRDEAGHLHVKSDPAGFDRFVAACLE